MQVIQIPLLYHDHHHWVYWMQDKIICIQLSFHSQISLANSSSNYQVLLQAL